METLVVTDEYIELLYAVTTNTTGLLIILLLFTYSIETFSIHNRQNKYFYLLFLVSFIELSSHLFITTAQYYNFFGSVQLGVILYGLVFVIDDLHLFAWIFYLNDHMRKYSHDDEYRKRIFYLSVPVSMMLVLSIMNLFIPVYFEYTGESYTRLPAYYLTLIIPFMYLVYGLLKFFNSNHRRSIYHQLPFVSILFPVVVAHVVEASDNDICCIPLSYTIALMMLVLTNVKHRSSVDGMTGLYSRQELYRFMETVVPGKQKLVGAMIDLNKFKAINDTHGHLVGDDALVEFGYILKTTLTNAVGYRYAGDEFIVLMQNGDVKSLEQMMQRLNERLYNFNQTSGKVYELNFSYGLATLEQGDDTNTFIAPMDKEMYNHKHGK